MSLLKPVTPEEAKRVWVSIPNPSARRVAKPLTQSGRRVHHSTIARWRAQDWRPVAHSLHPLEAARQRLDMAAGVLTCDPGAGLKVLSDACSTQQELEGLSDRELLGTASREMLIAVRDLVQGAQISAPQGKYSSAVDVLEALGVAARPTTSA